MRNPSILIPESRHQLWPLFLPAFLIWGLLMPPPRSLRLLKRVRQRIPILREVQPRLFVRCRTSAFRIQTTPVGLRAASQNVGAIGATWNADFHWITSPAASL